MAKLSLGLQLGYWGAQPPTNHVELAQEAERLGFDSVWTAESYGNDCFTPLAWIGAQTSKIRLGTSVAQLSARTPASCAMAAMAMDHLSGGRMILGLGVSGPQVVEAWYGQPYTKPLTRTREYVDIVRKVLARKEPVTSDGEFYPLPYNGPGSWGMGKPLKSILQACPEVPIYTASITPAGLSCAGEVADGVFPVWMDPNKYHILGEHIEKGFAKAGNGKSLKDFDIGPFVMVAANDDLSLPSS